MTETQTLSPFSDHIMHPPQNHISTPGLPKISKPTLKGRSSSKAEGRKVDPPLPQIRQRKKLTLPLKKGRSRHQGDTPSGGEQDFALDLQNKLKMVLENVNRGRELVSEALPQQQDIQFQQLVNQNMQILKQKKEAHILVRNRASTKTSQKSNKHNGNAGKHNTKKDQDAYQRRVKQYRKGSLENKYLQKKKEIIVQEEDRVEKLEQQQFTLLKRKQEKGIGKALSPSPEFIPKKLSLRGAQKKGDKKRQIQTLHSLPAEVKTDSIFDNIHNLLSHPGKKRVHSIIKPYSGETIPFLQQKLARLMKKLGQQPQSQQSKPNTTESMGLFQKTVTQWRRLEYNSGCNFKFHHDSNFEKQVDHLSNLQERNSEYLARLIEQQKKLVELGALSKKSLPSSQHPTR